MLILIHQATFRIAIKALCISGGKSYCDLLVNTQSSINIIPIFQLNASRLNTFPLFSKSSYG